MYSETLFTVTWILVVTEVASRIRHWPRIDDLNRNDTSAEKRLTRYLVKSYKRLGIEGRPVYNASQSMQVMFGLAMMQMDLDEQENTLSTSVWCRIRWKDEYLRWNPNDFAGISTVRLSSHKIWIPDIMLYNTADTQMMERDVLVVVKYDGSMLWIPHRIYRSSCKVDVTHFPFDQQVCHMTFGSWAYHGNEIDLQFHDDFERMDLSDLERENTEWEVLEKGEKRLSQTYDCCVEPYVTLTFTLRMKRKLVFSSFILTLPCIFLACMTLVVFWLPPDRPDRTSLAMNLFSCFLLLLLILVEAAPPTASSVPTLGVYYCFNMVLIMLSIFLSSIVINISRKGEAKEQVPSWLYKISIEGLGRVFCIQLVKAKNSLAQRQAKKSMYANNIAQRNHIVCNNHTGNSQSDSYNHSRQSCKYSVQGGCSYDLTGARPDITQQQNHMHHQPKCTRNSDVTTEESISSLLEALDNNHNTDIKLIRLLRCHLMTLEKSVRKIERHTRELIAAMKETDHRKDVKLRRLEWQIVGATVDRTCFVIFLVAIVSSLMTLFPKPYHLQS